MPSDIVPDIVIENVKCGNRRQVFSHITDMLVEQEPAIYRQSILDRIEESERHATCAIGNGVAIINDTPRALTEPLTILMKLAEPIYINAIDGKPVDCVYGMFTPYREKMSHLQKLSRVYRIFHDEKFCRQLRTANTNAEIHAIFEPEKNKLSAQSTRKAA